MGLKKTAEILGQNSVTSRTGKMVVGEGNAAPTPPIHPLKTLRGPGRLSGLRAESSAGDTAH